MKYIYRMSRTMFCSTMKDAKESNMTIEQYVAKTFGLLDECVKVEMY